MQENMDNKPNPDLSVNELNENFEQIDINQKKQEVAEETANDNKESASVSMENENTDAVKLEEENMKLKKDYDTINDKFIRKVAEFENYKRRTEQEKVSLLKYSNESFIQKLLPVIDDFDSSIDFLSCDENTKSVKDGVVLIYDKLMKILTDEGVVKIDALDAPFDFNLHEAVMQQLVDGKESMIVVQEIEKGYMYKDKVIRHSKVVVSA